MSEQVIRDYERELIAFFALPREVKAAVSATPDSDRGYRGKDLTALALSQGDYTPPDLIERFTMGRIEIPSDSHHIARAATQYQANRRLQGGLEMQQARYRYYCAMDRLAKELMRIFARALNLHVDYFDGYLDKHISHLVANYYAKPDAVMVAGQFRAGGHTDFGSLIILNPVLSSKGLQIRLDEQPWEDVVYVPGSFIINIGDLMARWTNDRWV